MKASLRDTLGWRLTRHAPTAADNRGFALGDVLITAAEPDVRYTKYHYGPGREVRISGDLAVVVHAPSRTILTVLWHSQHEWTDAEARSRSNVSRSSLEPVTMHRQGCAVI